MAAKKLPAKKTPAKKVPSPPRKKGDAKRGLSNWNPTGGSTATNPKAKEQMRFSNAKGYTPEGAWALGQEIPGNNMRGESKIASNNAALRKQAIANIRAAEQAAAKDRLNMAKKGNETPGSSSYPAKSSGVGRYSPNTNRKGSNKNQNNLAGLGRRILETRIQEEMNNLKQSKRNNKKK